MAVRIDEPRRDDPAAGVDHRLDVGVGDIGQVPDREDPVAEQADIGGPGACASAVNEQAAAQDQVEGRQCPAMMTCARRERR